ncbi:hypothetical protein PFBG_06183, partial [Plasmodium falciparum 7G8]
MEPKVAVTDYSSAKDFLDKFGQQVYDQVKKDADAEAYKNKLKGDLSRAKFDRNQSGQQTENDPCNLSYEYHTDVKNSGEKEYPCAKRSDVRFSDTEGAECDNRKIRDNDKKTGGACAPYRRLHLCDYNLENINDYENITNDTLLVDVCLAALHEGQSIAGQHGKYHTHSSGSTICTVLARSFADIGDIVRGKDLYRGNNGKDKLEENLKKIFEKIHDNLKNKEAQEYYKNNDDPYYYKLREDWWTANRATIWEALTCEVGSGTYFRPTCGDNENTATQAKNKCRCKDEKGKNDTDQVPTYFDYVPQYLRWFEEWAEDFCRKRKKQLENAKKQCRGDSGKPKYCDLNGLNCERTKYKIGYFVEGADCKKCSVACKRFVEWIAKQKKEFEKQKNKYDEEMKKYTNGESGSRRLRRGASTTNYNGYEKIFYDKLKGHYSDVGEFLEKLSNEEICKKVEDDKGGKIDFKTVDGGGVGGRGGASDSNNSNKTFAPTEYCDPCPMCGVDCSNGTCTKKDENTCTEETTEKKYPDTNTTKIPKLTAEKRKRGILQKYSKFCKNTNDQIENWQCHYEKTDKSNICVLQKEKQDTKEQKVTSYYSFFYGSIIDMLNESIDWKDKVNSCINKAKEGKCRKLCKNPCECYKRWVEKKQTEWTQIKDYFLKQEDLLKDIEGMDPGDFLEYYLKNNFLEDMKEAQGDPKVIEKFKEILPKENEEDMLIFLNKKRIIEEFLEKEKQKADECLKTHKDPCPQSSTPPGDLARAAVPSREQEPPKDE